MFSKDLEHTIGQCYKRARENRDEYMTVEHLLLALIDDPDASGVMGACNVDLNALKTALTLYVDNDLAALATSDGEDAKPTAGFQRVIQRAVIHVQSSGREEVTGANVLVGVASVTCVVALLVASRERAQDVKLVVEALKASGRTDLV